MAEAIQPDEELMAIAEGICHSGQAIFTNDNGFMEWDGDEFTPRLRLEALLKEDWEKSPEQMVQEVTFEVFNEEGDKEVIKLLRSMMPYHLQGDIFTEYMLAAFRQHPLGRLAVAASGAPSGAVSKLPNRAGR